MDFLYQQFPDKGYPISLFYGVLLVGGILIFLRPFYAFIFSVFGLAAKNFHAAVFTRTDVFGPYLNLADLLLWISFLSILSQSFYNKKAITLPRILLCVVAVIFVASLQSIVSYGLEPYVMRSIWSVCIFPLAFLASNNIVRSEARAKYFYWALFLGAFFAAMQHMAFLAGVTSMGRMGAAELRTISYVMNGGYFLLIVALFSKSVGNSRLMSNMDYFGLILIAISFIMAQTRQLYLVFVVTIIAFAFLFREHVKFHKTMIKIVVIGFLVLLISNGLYKNWSLSDIVGGRIESLTDDGSRTRSYLTRWLGIQTEMGLWLKSPLFIGVGTSYPPEFTEVFREGGDTSSNYFVIGALDHVAVSSYLAHFGLIGFSLYLIFLPLFTMLRSKRLLSMNPSVYVNRIALLAVAVALGDVLNMFGSMLNTSPASHVTGLIYGALWGVSSQINSQARETKKYAVD